MTPATLTPGAIVATPHRHAWIFVVTGCRCGYRHRLLGEAEACASRAIIRAGKVRP